ncbi:ESAT-6 protein secretion system EspG family protein [Amycolatopsis sulphurea]|uniref:ESAT-6 protein secretion system EspG family protein n=1 Tax=Amycolatopsis sulphurea TaxID=76022 RepID=A0A2A9FAS3_9PSEU|nr:ESX secretion-associated protein EspG [Amycolatopsis sulphurea]PFG48444.1 ESAT-6 protein secretion system EspG family protein [Amycolatopsis sulphurea]
MLVLDRALVLPADCLPLAAELAGVSLPAALSPDPLWRDPEETRQYHDTAIQSLAEHGAWSHGRPREDFLQTMTVLCRGASELSATIESQPARRYRLVVAAAGTDAVLACHVPASGQVLLRPARPDALAEELISELPTLPPATGPAMSVPESDLRQASQGAPARRDVRRVLDVATLPRTGAGQITATTRDRLGRHRTSSDNTCTYYDTQHGRYLFSFSKEPGHDRYINVTPARPETMITQLHALLHNLH